MKTKRQHLDGDTHQRLSLSCLSHLQTLLDPSWTIGTYITLGQEVDTLPLLDSYPLIAVPRIEGKGVMRFYRVSCKEELKPNRWGILEPVAGLEEVTHVDAMIVPVVAYNHEGYRLGMGGGYYDRYLAKHPCLTLGLAYCFQQCEDFSVYNHDIKLDIIVTEKGVTIFNENYHLSHQKDAFR